MIEQGTRFIGFSQKVDLSERKTANSNSETEPYTVDDIRGYKVFTALLSQGGGDDVQYINWDDNPNTLTIGVTYTITENDDNSNFIPNGAPNNNVGTSFIATSSVVAWGTGNTGSNQVSYNTGAPVATVLDNTIGNIWFSYNNDGYYAANSDNLFTIGKSSIIVGNTTWDGGSGLISSGFDGNSFAAIVTTLTDGTPARTGGLLNTLIEIRVYN